MLCNTHKVRIQVNLQGCSHLAYGGLPCQQTRHHVMITIANYIQSKYFTLILLSSIAFLLITTNSGRKESAAVSCICWIQFFIIRATVLYFHFSYLLLYGNQKNAQRDAAGTSQCFQRKHPRFKSPSPIVTIELSKRN